MKKQIKLASLALFCFILFLSCGEKEQEITIQSIALSQPSAELVIGETLNLKATISPSNATYDGITWTSTKTSVATVSGSGQVSALAEGNTTITAMAGGKTASCSITVVKGYVAVSSISLNKENLELIEGDSETLTATVSPNDATDKTVSWSSSNDAVATVKDGTITAVKEGEATITAKAGEKTSSCKVVVAKKVIPVENVSLDKAELSLIVGESAALVATVEPDNATDKSVSWSSSDESIASVSNSGIVSAKAAGDAIITAQAGDKSASCTVHIAKDPQDETIVFADNKLKERLVSAFDKNNDGELSYNEAAAVTSEIDLKSAFGSVKAYNTFDEFRFFTGITKLAISMFEGWTINSITLPPNLASIASSSFKGCALIESIVIPEGVSNVGDAAFQNCISLKSVVIPESVTLINNDTFNGCKNLIDVTLPNSLLGIGKAAFLDCSSLTNISIPDRVVTIGEIAFSYCTSLPSITIPESVRNMGAQAFLGCSSLKMANLSGSIGKCAFQLCTSLATITISNNVTSIGDDAFYHCTSLTSVTLPNSLVDIGPGAFQGCTSLVAITIPNNVKSIGAQAFCECSSLIGMIIPENVTSLGEGAFHDCPSLTSIKIPESISSIEQATFWGCTNLTYLAIPESVMSIGRRAFYYCDNLVSIIIPKNVARIGIEAFVGCESLKSITVLPGIPPTGESKMLYATNEAPIYVPSESVDAYKSTQYWSDYSDRIQAIPSPSIPEAIDLGLPSGVKWASFNLGASKPEEYGDYYAWGETLPKISYNWLTYKWSMGSKTTMTKYCSNSSYGYNGFTDNKTFLDPEDDAAHMNLGGKWRMPTNEERNELVKTCSWKWQQVNGVNGYKFTGPNGNSIFLPAAGYLYHSLLIDVGTFGDYWFSCLNTDSPDSAWGTYFASGYFSTRSHDRYRGQTVRPVCD